MRRLTRKERCALGALEHALAHEMPDCPVLVEDYASSLPHRPVGVR